MNIKKNPWVINERVDIQKREVLYIIAQSAGFRVASRDSYIYKDYGIFPLGHTGHWDGGIITYDNGWNAIYETYVFPIEGRAQISYDECIKRMKTIISHIKTNKKS